jgi:hypothetical protein
VGPQQLDRPVAVQTVAGRQREKLDQLRGRAPSPASLTNRDFANAYEKGTQQTNRQSGWLIRRKGGCRRNALRGANGFVVSYVVGWT